MSKNVEELKKIIDAFEKEIGRIREAADKEVRRARAIIRRLEKEKPH